MKKSLNRLSLCIIAVSVLSCEKHENHRTQGYKENNKGLKNTQPSTLVLVPNATRPRIAFLPDGDDALGLTPYEMSTMRDGIYTSNGTFSREIYNPNQFLGLPVDVGGIVFSGLAVDRATGYYDPSIILSRSRSSEHALFFASLNAASNYIINSTVILNTPYAPASSGWRLSYIEYHSNLMYGIFYNSSTQESIIAKINKNNGNTTFIKSFPGVKFEGMDFTIISNQQGVSPDKMYLKSGVAVGVSTCKIYTLNLANPSIYSSANTTIPTNYSMGGSNSGSFLVVRNFISPIYIYEPGNYTIHGYDPISNSSNTYVTQKRTVSLTTSPPTLGSPINFGGQAMNDAAR
ncbi:MAG: hypothetical protein ACO1N0_21910 [Fluviicola sp.]